MIIRMNMFLQFQDCIHTLEEDEYASKWLAQNILESLNDRRWLCHSIKNFLRFSKGRGFKEYIYRGVMDTTYSEFFLRKIR